MGNIFNSVLMSFNMYSILPLPYAKWKEENMKYVLIFFPLVGLVEALIYILVWKLGIMLKLESVFLAALLSVVSVIYTGGIHFDGYLDTCDALGSNQSMERKLEILRDSHIGAYALMGGIIYFILYFGAMMQIKSFTELLLFALSAIIVRAYSTLSLLVMKNARGSGLAATFTKPADKKKSIFCLVFTIVLMSVLLIYINIRAAVIVICAALYFSFHLYMAEKNFGGVSGDLCGHFFQMCELILLILTGLIFKS